MKEQSYQAKRSEIIKKLKESNTKGKNVVLGIEYVNKDTEIQVVKYPNTSIAGDKIRKFILDDKFKNDEAEVGWSSIMLKIDKKDVVRIWFLDEDKKGILKRLNVVKLHK